MGYPFDRVGSQRVRFLTEFLTPNMGVQTVTVRFQNIVKARPGAVNVPRINVEDHPDEETVTRSAINKVVPIEFTGAPIATTSQPEVTDDKKTEAESKESSSATSS